MRLPDLTPRPILADGPNRAGTSRTENRPMRRCASTYLRMPGRMHPATIAPDGRGKQRIDLRTLEDSVVASNCHGPIPATGVTW
jgi:hypothetical protein